ncbi:MaoC family dehydratase [soil metagenome]
MAEATLLFYEDFADGETRDLGAYKVTRDEVIAFAREFDPQDFHLDDEAALASPLAGLAASGWHTCGRLMRMMCDGYLNRTSGMGSPGIDEIKWLKPVRPGETLRGRMTVTGKRVSKSRPEMGLITMRWEAFNEAGECKIEAAGINLVRVRQP